MNRPRGIPIGAWAGALAQLGLLAAAETPPPLPGRTAVAVHALVHSPPLLRHSRGYLACLHARPDLAEAEAAYWRLAGVSEPWDTLSACEDALDRSEDARAVFDRFYDALARDGNLLTAFEAAAGPAIPRGVASELRDLAGLFGASGLAPDVTGENLSSLWGLLQDRAEAFGGSGLADAGAAWRSQLAALDSWSGGAFGRLAAHFLEHAETFRVWHRRNLALARHAEIRPWVRWWHARMREHDRLRRVYPAYAAELLENADAARNAEAAWRVRFGAAPPWPPVGAPPPERAPGPAESGRESQEETPTPEVRAPRHPGKPGVPMPKMPEMPARPGKPPKP